MQLQDMWPFRIFGVLSANNSRSGNNACICSDSLSLSLQHSTTAKREYPTTEKREHVISALVAPSQFSITFFFEWQTAGMMADLLNAVPLRGGGTGTNYRGPEVRVCCINHHSLTDDYAPRYARVTFQMRVSRSDLVWRPSAGPPLLGGLKKCHRGSIPLSAVMLAWPASSPDLKPFHVYLRGNLKRTVYSPSVQLLVQWNSNKMKRADSHRDMGLLGYYAAYSGNS